MGWFDKIASRIATELEASALDPDDRGQLELARGYLDRGDLSEAGSRLDPLLQKHPRSLPVLHVAGQLEQAKGNWETAVSYFGTAADTDPSDAHAWLSLAQALMALERFEPALEACRRATNLFERVLDADTRRKCLAQAHVLRGRVALAQSRFEVARREFDRALTLGVDDQDVAADHGRALMQLDREEGARWLLHAVRKASASVALALEAADAQSNAAVAADLLIAFARSHAQLSEVDQLKLQARTALALATSGQKQSAEQIILALKNREPAQPLPGTACQQLARASALLNDYQAACEWAVQAELDQQPIPPHEHMVWALGTCKARTLGELTASLERTDPDRAAQITAALASPANPGAVAMLVQHAPTSTARDHWAQLLAPALPDEASALALLQGLEQVVTPLPPSPELAASLARAREALSRPLVVALLGEFNAGKSSLVNALVQTALSPVGNKPTTATLNVFRHGMGGAHVVYRSGKVRRLQSAQVQAFLSTLAPEDAEAIAAVDIFLPHAPLQTFEWVDTPGLNAANASHERTTREFMSSADVAVWVLSASQAAKATEVAVLKQLHDHRTPVFAVLNKVDQLEPHELSAVHQAVVEALNQSVFGVMDASLKTEASAQQAALELWQALTQFCAGRVGQLKQRSALLKLRGLVAEACAQAARFESRKENVSPDAELWSQVTNNLAQPAAVAALHTALSQMVSEVVTVFPDAGTDTASEEALIRAYLRHLGDALNVAGARLTDLPQTAAQQFETAAQVFAAQARGRLEAGLAAQALASSSPGDARRKLEQALPDVERFLWTPWRNQLQTLVTKERDRQLQAQQELASRAAVHRALFALPLQTLQARIEQAWLLLLPSFDRMANPPA